MDPVSRYRGEMGVVRCVFRRRIYVRLSDYPSVVVGKIWLQEADR